MMSGVLRSTYGVRYFRRKCGCIQSLTSDGVMPKFTRLTARAPTVSAATVKRLIDVGRTQKTTNAK